MIKKLAYALFALFFLSFPLTVIGFALFATFPFQEQEIDLEVPKQAGLRIRNPSGLIHVEGGDDTAFSITVSESIVPRLHWLADAALRRFRLNTEADAQFFTITAELPSRWWGHGKVSFQLKIPRNTQTDLRLEEGNINLHQMTGPIHIKHTGTGIIVLSHTAAPTIIQANEGEIRADLTGDLNPVQVQMRSGSIMLVLHTAHPGPLSLSLTEGVVSITLHPQTNAVLTYQTSGTVVNPLLTDLTEPQLGGDRSVSLILGGGGSPLVIQAGSADLTFSLLAPEPVAPTP